MTADEELLAGSLRRLVDVDDAGLDERVLRFQDALRRLRTDPDEAARIDALVTDVEHGPADTQDTRSSRSGRSGTGPKTGNWLARWRSRMRWPGNLLILACGADYRRMNTADRQRYITMSVLMLLATAQAFYCGTTVAQMSFSRPFLSVAGYGLFLAGSVFFIDRSIVSYIAPRIPGNARSKKTRYPMRAIALRIALACVASFLLAEVMLLQVFAPRINIQLASDNLSSQQAAATQINAYYQQQIIPWRQQVAQAQATVNSRQTAANRALKQFDCQLFGCAGVPAGAGPAAQAARLNLNSAQAALSTAQEELQVASVQYNSQVRRINDEQQAATLKSAQTTSASRDMLAREQAFWIISVKYPEVAFARILLTLLLLSIDLAPVIVKATSRHGVYEEEIRTEILLARARTEAYAETQEKKIREEAAFEMEYLEIQTAEKLRELREGRQREAVNPESHAS